MGPPTWALLFFAMVFSIPLALISIPFAIIWSNHKRKMEELKMQRQQMIADNIRAEFAAIRDEIRDLRDTSMQYDLSFDTALQQMDRRLSHLERQSRVQTAAPNAPLPGDIPAPSLERPSRTQAETTTQQNVTLGGRG